MANGRSGGVLAQLVDELNARRIRVVDLATTPGRQAPPTGAVVIAAPLKIAGGSGSPLRVIALAPA